MKKITLSYLIIRLFTAITKFFAFLYLNSPKIFRIANLNEKNSNYRSILIRETAFLLQKILIKLNYSLPITISKDRIIVDVDGVLLIQNSININFKKKHKHSINRYYKKHNQKYYNEAKLLDDSFKFTYPKIIIDLGACIGEYSIYFAKKYPQSTIYSIEANSNNFRILQENIKINRTEKNIKVFNNAISDKENENYFSTYGNQDSEVIISNNNNHINKTITLSSLLHKEKLNKIDLIKIDIESSNYKVVKCIINNLDKIENIYYEFSKGPQNIFIDLIERVQNIYDFYICDNGQFIITDAVNLIDKIKKNVFLKEGSLDIFFKKK